jgi:hypothetical protein
MLLYRHMTKQKQHNVEAQAKGFFYGDSSEATASAGPESQQNPGNTGLPQNQSDQPRVIGVQDSLHTWKGGGRPIDPARIMSVGSYSNNEQIVFGVLAFATLGIAFWFASSEVNLVLKIILLFIGFLVLIYLIIIKLKQAKKWNNIMQEFASRNSFHFNPGVQKISRSGSFFKVHDDGVSNTHINGFFGGLPFSMFAYHYSVRRPFSNRSETESVFVMELTLPRVLPHMVIDSLVESEGGWRPSVLPVPFEKSQRMKLEGNFYKYFEVYAPDNHAVTLLAIIAPNVMEALMQHATKYDIEIIDNKLYFYTSESKPIGDLIMETFTTAQQVLDKIGKKLCTSNIYSDAYLSSSTEDVAVAAPRLRVGWFESISSYTKYAVIPTVMLMLFTLYVHLQPHDVIRDLFLDLLLQVLFLSLIAHGLHAALRRFRH